MHRLVPPRPVTHSKHPQQARPHQPALPCTPPPLCPGSNHSAPTTDAGGDKSLSVSNLIIASTYSVVAVGAVVLMRAIQDVDALQQPPAHAGPGDEPLLVPLLKRRKCSLYKASAATRLWSARAASDPGSSPHPNPNPSSNPSSNPHPAPTPHQVLAPKRAAARADPDHLRRVRGAARPGDCGGTHSAAHSPWRHLLWHLLSSASLSTTPRTTAALTLAVLTRAALPMAGGERHDHPAVLPGEERHPRQPHGHSRLLHRRHRGTTT